MVPLLAAEFVLEEQQPAAQVPLLAAEFVLEEQQPDAQDPLLAAEFVLEEQQPDAQVPLLAAEFVLEEQQPAAQLPPAGNLDFLAYDEQFQNLRAAVQPALLQYFEATPHLNQIRQHPVTFLGLLAEPPQPQPQPQPQRNNLEEVDLGGTSHQDFVPSIPAEDRVSIPSKGKEKILLIGESSSAVSTWQEGLTEQKGESSRASYDAQAPGAGPTPSGSSAMTGFPDAKPETVDKVCQIPDDSAVSGESKFSAPGADSLDTDTRARRTNISFGNCASASARDVSLHSVTKFSENSSRETDQDGPAAEQQLNSDAGQVATQSEPQNAGYIDPEVLAATSDVEDANTVPEKKKASESETSSGESQAEMRRPPDRGTTSTAETSKKKKRNKSKNKNKDKRDPAQEVLQFAPEEDVIDEAVGEEPEVPAPPKEEEQQPAAHDPAQEVLPFAPEEDVIHESVGQEPEVPAPPEEEEQQPAAQEAETSKKKNKKKNKKERLQVDEDMLFLEEAIQQRPVPVEIKIRDIEAREASNLALTVKVLRRFIRKDAPKKGPRANMGHQWITVGDDTGIISIDAKGSESDMVEDSFVRLTYAETYIMGGRLLMRNIKYVPIDPPGWEVIDNPSVHRSLELHA